MKKFKLEIDLGNAAFDEDPTIEVFRILSGITNRLRDGADVVAPTGREYLHDINGNEVGYWVVL